MTIIQLYKIHINPEPTKIEIKELFKRFDVEDILLDPGYWCLDWHSEKEEECKKWIIKNSKL